MTSTSRNIMAVCVCVLALLSAAQACVREAPAPQAPPAPTVTTYRDAAAAVTCWLAHGPHGVGISCLRDAQGVFAP